MRKRFRWLTTAVGIVVLSLTVLPQTAVAESQDLIDPSGFPTGSANPDIFGTAHTLRYSGSTRYNSNLSTAMAQDANYEDFPFDLADRTYGNDDGEDPAHIQWGHPECAYSIIVTAGDVPFDSLAAASLSDPTDSSEEPFLRRVAAEDPSSDPIGGFGTVDTDAAPIVLTRSAREGATALSPTARLAAQHHEDDFGDDEDGCAEDAIIVGGSVAVPTGVADELVALGYERVYRIDGTDRFDSARDIAMALGTEFDGGLCSDTDALDGSTSTSFYENSVVEYRPDGETCMLLNRSIALADGGTGADAMASTWWTSFFQVPVLFTNPDGTLPAATTEGLEALDVDNLIVLGGTTRIPDATMTAAGAAASATALRVAGNTRYGTSVEMAELFGGYYGQGLADDNDSNILCLAAHGGEGAAATGWPDALGGGPLCSSTSGYEDDPHPPDRQFPPVNGSDPYSGGSGHPSHDISAMLLTAPGSSSLPTEVSTFLDGLYPAAPGDGEWSTGSNGGDYDPGFGMIFGGSGVIPDAAMRQFATALSGDQYTDFGDHMSPTLDPGFFTMLDLSTVFTDIGDGGANRACFTRGGIVDTLRLAAYDDAGLTEFDSEGDVVNDNDDIYLNDNDGTVRATPTASSAPACLSFADDGLAQVPEDLISSVLGVSLSGHQSDAQTFDYSVAKFTGMSGSVSPAVPATPAVSGGGMASDTDVDASTVPDATTTWTYGGTGTGGATSITVLGQTAPITSIVLNATLTRGNDSGIITAPDVVTGTFTITTGVGTVTGTFTGEALFSGAAWEIRGMSTVTGGTFSSGAPAVIPVASTGGFTASIAINGAGTADDTVGFQFDAIAD